MKRLSRAAIGRTAVFTFTFLFTFTIRVWGVSTRFWLLEDQIRDWAIALRPFGDLPLVGPPTHVHGYTIGPAFYWILWAIRVTLGPWFEYLPHAGGIGHALLQSAADVLLLVAIWRRTGSLGIAFGAVLFLATAAYDVALAGLVWNPVMGSILAKTAIALVLLRWHGDSMLRLALVAALTWAAVHTYTGAVFVAAGVFAALLVHARLRNGWAGAWRCAAVIAMIVALLQVPYVIHQVRQRFESPAMAAVTGGVRLVLTGEASPEVRKSISGYAAAVEFVELAPLRAPAAGWVLLGCAGVFAWRYRGDASLLALILLPQIAAIAGFALFLGALDHYYYLSLMPIAVLTIVFALLPRDRPSVRMGLAITLLVAVAALVPGRLRYASTLHKMPEYEVLVSASRQIRNRHQPMRAIRTEFALPPTADPQFLYRVLGGRLDRSSPWVAIIAADGRVRYVRVPGR